MRNAKLIVPVILVVAVAALIGALAARSMGDSNKQAVVKTRMVGAKTLLVNRRGFTLYHLSVERRGHFICTRCVPRRVAPARRREGQDTDRREVARHREASRRAPAGGLQGRPALHVRRGPQARRHEGQRLQGRRHVARRDGLRPGSPGAPAFIGQRLRRQRLLNPPPGLGEPPGFSQALPLVLRLDEEAGRGLFVRSTARARRPSP